MIEIPIGLLISGIITWAGNKAIPAVFKHHNEVQQQRYEAAKDLCEKHNDCEAYKIYSLQGMKNVVRLKQSNDGQITKPATDAASNLKPQPENSVQSNDGQIIQEAKPND